MSLFRRAATLKRTFQGIPGFDLPGLATMIPGRTSTKQGAALITHDRALRHSGVWAATRLRADLISTFPVGVFRDRDGLPVESTAPPIIVSPGGREMDFQQWMWASQHDLDHVGNAIGLITERTGISTPFYPEGTPYEIQLQDTRICSVIMWKGQRLYRIGDQTYLPKDVYHERQFPWPGTPVGLNPLLYAAASIGEYLSLQQYGLDWFAGGGVPKAWMKNTVKRLGDTERDGAKSWYRDTIQNGDVMVTGNDWEYNMIQAEQAGMEWLEGRRFGMTDIARFYGVPADLMDAAISGQSVTYANITQRNLQFLIMNLGPAVIRRERNLTNLLPAPRYVKLNTDALLRMDPQTRQQVIMSKLETWQLTLDEARALDENAPLTTEQEADMVRIFGKPKMSGAGAVSTPAATEAIADVTPDPPAPVIAPAPAPGQPAVGAPDKKQIESAPAK